MSIDRLEAFIPQMLSKMHIECLVHGNANKDKALQMVQIVQDALTSSLNMSPLLPRQLLLNRELKLEDGCHYIYEKDNKVMFIFFCKVDFLLNDLFNRALFCFPETIQSRPVLSVKKKLTCIMSFS